MPILRQKLFCPNVGAPTIGSIQETKKCSTASAYKGDTKISKYVWKSQTTTKSYFSS